MADDTLGRLRDAISEIDSATQAQVLRGYIRNDNTPTQPPPFFGDPETETEADENPDRFIENNTEEPPPLRGRRSRQHDENDQEGLLKRMQEFLKRNGKKIAKICAVLGVSVAALILTLNLIFSSPSRQKGPQNDSQILIEMAIDNGMDSASAVRFVLENSPDLSLNEKVAIAMVNLDLTFEEAAAYIEQLGQVKTSGGAQPGPSSSASDNKESDDKKSEPNVYNLTFNRGVLSTITAIPDQYVGGVALSAPGYFLIPPVVNGVQGDWFVKNPRTGIDEVVRSYEDLERIFPNGNPRPNVAITLTAGREHQAQLEIKQEDLSR